MEKSSISLFAAPFLLALTGPLLAQDYVASQPAVPAGFFETKAISGASRRTSEDEGGLELTVGLGTLYDSNVSQASGNGVERIESDWVNTPNIEAAYLLGGGHWRLGTRVKAEHRFHQNRDDYDATNYSVSAFGGFQSKKFVASFSTSVGSKSGLNRNAAGFVERFSSQSGLLARYNFTRKTSLLATWDINDQESRTRGYGDTSSMTTGLSGIWQATPLLSVGPGFRYGLRTGDDGEELTVVGPTLRLDYQLSSKVKLRSTLGIDSADSPYSGTDTLYNWSLALNYRASSLWGFDLEAIRDTRATLSSGGGFDEISSYRFNYWRKIRRSKVEIGLEYEDRSPTDSLVSVNGLRASQYLVLSTGVTFPVFQDNAELSLDLNWRDLSSSDRNSSWDGFRTGVGLQWNF